MSKIEPLDKTGPQLLEELKKGAGVQKRRSTPLWIWIDEESCMFRAEFPELEGAEGQSPHNDWEAAHAATHILHCVLQHAIRTNVPVPWRKVDRQPPKDANIRTISVAY